MRRLVAGVTAALLMSIIGLRAQEVQLLTFLDDEVEETSGLLEIEGRLITHNDSGGEPVLYEVDTLTGDVLRRVTLINADNKDWEDICADDTYIYVGDIGNNNGNRTDLRIYRITIADYFASDSVTADTIAYHYADQTDFSSSLFSTDFDAEGLTVIGDSLFIFTKNWGNFRTNVYTVPTLPGTYTAHRRDSLNTEGMVTGAAYNPENGILALSGYTLLLQTFVTLVTGYPELPLEAAAAERISYMVPPGVSRQTEAVYAHLDGGFYLSAERSFTGAPALMHFKEGDILSAPTPESARDDLRENLLPVHPNPTAGTVTLPLKSGQKALIYDMNGKQCAVTDSPLLSTEGFSGGTYILIITDRNGKPAGRAKFIVE